MQTPYVPEIDVIIGVAKWLNLNEWQLEKVSPPLGLTDKRKIETELVSYNISTSTIDFRRAGEDIRARKGNTIWKIECKGLSSGEPETVKNNFDRAVASCVSYFTKREELRLGLALPDSEEYKKFLRDKLPQALRETIELWVLLYCSKDEVYEFAPNEVIPH